MARWSWPTRLPHSASSSRPARLQWKGLAPTAPSSTRACRPPGPPPGRKQAARAVCAICLPAGTPTPTTLQDPLSIRCMPSIHGALFAAIDQARIGRRDRAQQRVRQSAGARRRQRRHVDRQFPHGGTGACLRDARARDRAGGCGERRPFHPADRRRPQRPAEISVTGRRRFGRLRAAAEDRCRDPRRDPPQGQSGDAGFPDGVGRRRGPRHADAADDLQMRRDDRAVAAPDRLRADGGGAGGRSQEGRARAGNGEGPCCRPRARARRSHEDRPLGADAEALYAALSSGKWQA